MRKQQKRRKTAKKLLDKRHAPGVGVTSAGSQPVAAQQEGVDTPPGHGVELTHSPITATEQEQKTMTITLKTLSKNGRAAIYTGALLPIRLTLANFPGKTAPQTIEVVDGAFAPARKPKVKMTAEERKAARANKPKPTLAERAAAAQARADKLAAEAAKASAQPTM